MTGETTPSGDAGRELECLIAMGALAGRVAHEINNPLASIQNAFLLVKDAIPSSHPHYAYVAAIEREIQRIATVTRRLAESYRPEQDRAVGVAVSAIVGDAVNMAVADGGPGRRRFQIEHQVHDPFCGPAGLLRHALYQVFEAAARSGLPDLPIGVTLSVDDADRLSVVASYQPGPRVKPRPDHYPERLVAAMGGRLETRQSGVDRMEFLVRVPMTPDAGAPP